MNNKTKFNLIEVIIIILFTGIICFITSSILIYNNIKKNTGIDIAKINKDNNVKKLISAYNTLDFCYEDLDKNELTDTAIDSMIKNIKEDNTYYLSKEKTKELNNILNDKQSGMGISLIIKNNDIIINEVLKNSPAFEAGLKVGDKLISINKKNIADNYNVLNELFTNNKKIKIKVLRNNNFINYVVKPRTLNIKNISSKKYNINEKRILFIKLKLFSKSSYQEFKKILEKSELNKIDGLIIDLKDNNGGYLKSSRKIAELFIEKNKNLYILKNKNKKIIIKDKTKAKRNYDIAILVNHNTASAAEVLAISLKESYGAIIIGQKTYGKNSVQNTKMLANGAMIKYTKYKWYSPNNKNMKNGIKPDIITTNNKELETALNYFK